MGFAAGDTNLYRYVGNEPTDQQDSSGLDDKVEAQGWLIFSGTFGHVPPKTIGDIENRRPLPIQVTGVTITGSGNPTGFPGGGIKITIGNPISIGGPGDPGNSVTPTSPGEGGGGGPITIRPIGTWPITPVGLKPPKDAEYELDELWKSLGGQSL